MTVKVPVSAKFTLQKNGEISKEYNYLEVEESVFINTLAEMVVKAFDLDSKLKKECVN